MKLGKMKAMSAVSVWSFKRKTCHPGTQAGGSKVTVPVGSATATFRRERHVSNVAIAVLALSYLWRDNYSDWVRGNLPVYVLHSVLSEVGFLY